MQTGFGFARLFERRRFALLTLLWVFALPIARPAAQMTEEERAAALERLENQLSVEGATGRLVERTPGSFDFVPEGEPLILPISNPDRIASAAVARYSRSMAISMPTLQGSSYGITRSISRQRQRPRSWS